MRRDDDGIFIKLSDLDPSLMDADSEQIYIPKVLFEHNDFKGLTYKEILFKKAMMTMKIPMFTLSMSSFHWLIQ